MYFSDRFNLRWGRFRSHLLCDEATSQLRSLLSLGHEAVASDLVESCISSIIRTASRPVPHQVWIVPSGLGLCRASIPGVAVCHPLRLLTLYRYLCEKRPRRGKAMPPSSASLCLHLFFMFFKLVNRMTINRNTFNEESRGNCCLSGQVV